MDEQQDYVKIKKIYIEVLFGITIGVVLLILSFLTNSFINYSGRHLAHENSFLYIIWSSFLFLIGAIILVTSIFYGIQKITIKSD